MRRSIQLLALPVAFLLLAVLVHTLQAALMRRGLLNHKDMTFVGPETGTLREHLLNVWHWDALGGLLVLGTAVCTVVSIFAALRPRHDQPSGDTTTE